jgi:hypothetical protein
MKFAVMCAVLASVSVGISACNKAKSLDEVQANVAKATSEAAEANAQVALLYELQKSLVVLLNSGDQEVALGAVGV